MTMATYLFIGRTAAARRAGRRFFFRPALSYSTLPFFCASFCLPPFFFSPWVSASRCPYFREFSPLNRAIFSTFFSWSGFLAQPFLYSCSLLSFLNVAQALEVARRFYCRCFRVRPLSTFSGFHFERFSPAAPAKAVRSWVPFVWVENGLFAFSPPRPSLSLVFF